MTRLGKSSYSWTFADRGSYKSVVATYRDIEKANTPEVLVGEGEPAFRLPHTYSNESNARRAARARLDDFKRTSGGTVQITQEARLDVIAESPIILVGYRQGLNGEYVARRVTHTLSKGGALTTSIDCEKGISKG
jgi:phage protein D